MSNDIARLGYEIDSSQAKTAAAALDKMNASAMKAERGAKSLKAASRDLMRDDGGRFMSAAQAAGKYGDEIDQLRTKYNPLYAASKQFEAQQTELQRALALGAISVRQYDTALAGLQAGMLRSGSAMAGFGKGMQASSQHTNNMLFQFQDIGMMLAAGQNPLMLAMQQGTQVVGIFKQMEGTGQSAFSAIKGGLLAMVSPMSLMTIGVIAGGAALVQWGISALGAGEDTKTFRDMVDELEGSVSDVNEISKIFSSDGLQSLVDKYGEVNSEILAMIENQKTFAINAAMETSREAISELRGEYSALQGSVELYAKTGRGDMASLTSELGLTKTQVIELARAMNDASNADNFEDQASALGRVNAVLFKSKISASELAGTSLDAESAMRQLAKSAADANSSSMSGLVSEIERVGRAAASAAAYVSMLSNTGQSSGPDSARTKVQWKGGAFALPVTGAGLATPDDTDDTGGGGGGGSSDPYAANLERLITSLQTERETVDTWYKENLTVLQDRRATEILSEQEHNAAKLALEAEYQERKSKLAQGYDEFNLGSAEKLFGELYSLSGSKYEGLLKIQKTFGAASALVSTYTAASQVLADPKLGFFAKFAAVAKTVAAGMGLVNAIKGSGSGGGGGGASGPTSATSARAEPERTTRIELMGEEWLVNLAESMMDQIYTATGKGRVIISKATA